MSQNDELDIGPLTWVKNEIDSALNAAREKLGEVLRNPEQREPLRFAQNHIHQAAGALSIVGLDGVSQFADAIDKFLSSFSASSEAPGADRLALAQRSIGILGNYINEIAAGAPHQPLRLFPTYQELALARGVEAPLPSELFFPDLNIRPHLANPPANATLERLGQEMRGLRAHFEKGSLTWLRKPKEAAGPQEMLRVVRRIEQFQQPPAARMFWWISIAFFEGLVTQDIPTDRQAQRVCRRIDAQVRRLLEGSTVVAERLVRDVLYFVVAHKVSTPHGELVRQVFKLDRMLPSADAELSDTYRQPLVLRVRETIEQCKEYWNRFSAGAATALPQFREQFTELVKRVQALRLPLVDRLMVGLGQLVDWLGKNPQQVNEDLSMEVATALLVVEQACDAPNADLDLLTRQVSLLCTQFAARIRGEKPGQLDDQAFGATARHAQERLFFIQLAREILTNLGHIEQGLDSYFRNPGLRDSLASLAGPLKQIEGAFVVLGDSQAVDLVKTNAELIASFVTRDHAPSQDELDGVAHQLSALGFYVEALKNGHAKLADYLNPLRANAQQEEAAEAAQSIESQLQRETQTTQQLVEALKETPQNKEIRQQLVNNLEAIREDAQLVADTGLEQKAKDALANLKSDKPDQVQLAETLASVAPVAVAAAPSEEAARLMTASNEELDAELLGIFLEEAHEVLDTMAENTARISNGRQDAEAQVTIRRGYHTLKGSSRMVGLQDFSEAARHVEMAMNRWLQLEKAVDADLLALINAGHSVFTAWVVQLEAGGSLWYDAAALIAQAEALLASLDMPLDEVSAPIKPVPAAPVVPTPQKFAEQPSIDKALEATTLFAPTDATEDASAKSVPAELDLTSTLLGSDLFAIPSGEYNDYEVDLAATDFDGDALRLFTTDEHEQRRELAAEMAPPAAPAVPAAVPEASGGLDFELSAFDLDEEVIPAPEPVMGAGGEDEIKIESEDEELTELDLTSTFISGELDAMVHGEEEVDLTSTGIELDFGEAADEIVVDEISVAEEVAPVQPAEELAPKPVVEPEPVARLIVEPSPPEELEIVDIDGTDSGIDLPQIEALLHGAGPSGPVAAAEEVGDTEVQIGNQSLSRGLYDLYVAEARQYIERLVEEHRLLESSPLRVPVIESVRSAHTLAGISGTARIDPAYTLGKALEHALHRFTDVSLPPAKAQTAIIGAAIERLDEMLADVVLLEMPVAAPELIIQLEDLHPEAAVAEEEPVAEPLPVPEEELELPELESVFTPEPEPDLRLAPVPEPDALVLEVPPAEAGVEEIEVRSAALEELPAAEIPALEEEELPVDELGNVVAEEEEEASVVHDELDDQLLPIFFEEADELGAALGGELRELRANLSDESHLQSVARMLHTLKGSARMAGAMRLGGYVHSLEGRLQEHTGGTVDVLLVDDLESGLDHIGALIENLRNPNAPVAVEPVSAGAQATAPVVAPQASATPAQVAKSSFVPTPQPAFDELEIVQGQRAPLRVRADLVDRFVNEAGEVSIARTRIEGELRTLRRSLLDLTENVIRLRNQLREVEIQAESQMQSRIAAAESLHSEFDPLEFDRFTRLQELTRMMAESVGDVTTIQQNLLRNLDAADAALHAQGRLSRDLQQALMGVRMVPFDELADRLYRIVRQTSKELGKRVNLDIQGGSIEIDRSVLDRMTAPIEHLLRNAIAHGIEMPAERVAAGKAEFGQITLKLNQLSNEIALELSDDGYGLNYERILARGRKNGLIGDNEQPSENRLTQLIFEPGFSTAEAVSGVAGRGVGMDVVKNETLAVGGRVDVSSGQGTGTRFIVHLPLTLAVTQALLVRAGDRTYAIPSNMVEQALEVKEVTLDEMRARGYVEWNNTQYPFAYLPRLLGDTVSHPVSARFHWLLLTRAGSQTLAVHIDELRGNQEIVVKNAGPQFVRLQGFSGATVLPDGEISLILNPVALSARQVVNVVGADGEGEYAEAEAVAETRIPTIMVVDDSLTVRKITSRLLEREGFQVVTAKDGVDALEQLVDIKPDVMLLDIEMPRMDGFDLARNIRADQRLHDIPIIMITSRMADKHRNYAMEIGVNNYLGKPYQEEQLLELIAGFIARKR
ncbi:Hpt domain-containing protein [Uliginosibacterium gangwonense]|uniref:Hpt domain-containing protein n=1 Tax=Uliginosibacterium gangwonense TaxID=392736 RepID=UPI00037D8FCA|nr:Hpt domain-containing protein [Uliginosibacterium gangwonense]